MKVFTIAVIALIPFVVSKALAANVVIDNSIDAEKSAFRRQPFSRPIRIVSTAGSSDSNRPYFTMASLMRRYSEFGEQLARGIWTERVTLPEPSFYQTFYFYPGGRPVTKDWRPIRDAIDRELIRKSQDGESLPLTD